MLNLKKILFRKKYRKILVLSGWGFRGLYTVWVLKWLEELGLDKEIDAIFGVSIWAIVGALWAHGISADEIYGFITDISWSNFYSTDFFKKTGGMLSNKKIKTMLKEQLPKRFSDLQKELYVGVVDTNTAEYLLFKDGDLQNIVLWSMSIPWAFPPVKYENYNLVDGGVLDNFPIELAKKQFPRHKTIWVVLSKFQENQTTTTILDNVSVSFEIMLRANLKEKTKCVDYLFFKKVPIPVLSLNKTKMKEAFESGYQDCINKFKK